MLAADHAGRRGARSDDEVGRAERAAAQIDELRGRVAGAAHARVAAQRLELLRQRDRVELHDVRARRHAFEVILAFVVGDGIAAVLEVDAHARDAFAGVDGGVAGAGVDAAEQQRRRSRTALRAAARPRSRCSTRCRRRRARSRG